MIKTRNGKLIICPPRSCPRTKYVFFQLYNLLTVFVATNWTAWSTCAATGCGTNAVKSRTRVVSGSGKRDTVGCGWTEPTCWSDWGECGGACGTTAFRTRSRSGAPSPLAPDGLNDESEQCDYQMPSCNLCKYLLLQPNVTKCIAYIYA